MSIILFALLPGFNEGFGASSRLLLRMSTRLLLLPLVAGVSYEIIKIAGRGKNKCVKLLTKPGLWLQHLTTNEPDDEQIEVAITSMKAVIPHDKESDKW